MKQYSLSRLADAVLSRQLSEVIARDRGLTAVVLAHVAEFDARKLYLPAGYSSMHAYCIHELHMSEDAAYKRIQAARAARNFPVLFEAVAAGQLHLSGVCLLAPHLTSENVASLISEAAWKTKAGIAELLAARFPGTESLPLEQVITSAAPTTQLAPGQVGASVSSGRALAPGQVRPNSISNVEPIAAGSFLLQLMVGQETRDKLRRAQELMSHRLPSRDPSLVIDHALDALIANLEKQKFAATSKPRPGRRSSHGRHIPAAVKREVAERDGGQCTYVSESGRRCEARARLEFDHIQEFARGGEATTENVRLRCRAHNQFTAEQTFGAEFMESKRGAAKKARAPAVDSDVVPWLRALGIRADDARRAAERCESMLDASLELRVKRAVVLRTKERHVRSGPGGVNR